MRRNSPSLRRGITRGAGTLLAAGVIAASLLAPAPSASADPATDGFWYFDLLGIQAAHDAGFTGKGVTIGVIDGQINLDVPTLQGADIEVQPSTCYDDDRVLIPATASDISADHATNIVSYLVGSGAGYPGQTGVKGIVPDAKIIYTSIGQELPSGFVCNAQTEEQFTTVPIADGIFAAIDAGADIISISLGGGVQQDTILAIAEAVNKGIPVLVGVPNQMSDSSFPSTANGVIGVQAADSNLQISGDDTARVNPDTDVVGPGVNLIWQGDATFDQQRYATGTSLATPIVAGFLALAAQKYPDATGNQLIQSLVRNTGNGDHELSYDNDNLQFGYGTASAGNLLRTDPRQYEDVNLLISDDANAQPTRAEIENPASRDTLVGGKTGFETSTSEPVPPSAVSIPVVPILLGGLGLLVVLAVIALIIVLAVRRGRGTPPA